MKQLRKSKTADDTEFYNERVNSLAPVEFKILRRINQVESRHPADDSERQNNRSKIDISSLSDPGANRGNGERQPKKKMGRSSEAFRERIKEHGPQRNWREHKGQPIDCCSGGQK